MPLKQSIAAKIFGLAVFLLFLTLGLALFLLREVARTETALRVVAQLDVPLTESISRIQEFGLRRRMAFERLYGALDSTHMNQEIITEASSNYTTYNDKLMAEFIEARRLLGSYPSEHSSMPGLIEARSLLEQIQPAYPIITNRQQEILELQRARKFEQANQMIGPLNDLQLTVQNQRDHLLDVMTDHSASSASTVADRERYVLWLTIAATASTILLGLAVAALITQRLTRPVRSLVTAIRDVQQGNLEVQLPVRSTDEVGVLTNAFNFFVQELRSKAQIKSTFGKYLDPRVLEQVLTQSGVVEGRQVMTVMFADLVGFTSLSERLTPSLMVNVLNRHFGLQALAVQEHQGVVDKFLGDAIMGFWGPPFVAKEDHARLACRAAWGQLKALETLRQELPEITGLRKDTPTLDVRIGICTGDVVVGNIGSESTRSYTVIGDTVNLTSRIEGANRIYGTRILIAESTAQSVSPDFETREIDAVAVKGKTEVARVFELLGPRGEVGESTLHLRECFGKALACYRAQDWDAAESAFRECLAISAHDGPATLFLKRIPFLKTTPPGAEWNGVWVIEGK